MQLPYYMWYEATHALLGPARALAGSTKLFYNNPVNPMTHSPFGRSISAACEMFERATRRYGKPEFNFNDMTSGGQTVAIIEEVVWTRPFCNLLHFRKQGVRKAAQQPKVLIVAPMSGHYATLLRGTVEAFLPTHDVYITDWTDARTVPLNHGRFDLDDYIDYVIAMAQLLGDRGIEWFKQNCIVKVPLPNPGFMREVYPGFLQLSGFMAMNIDRHIEAHGEMFNHLVHGDGDSADKHIDFYDEYMAVMDLTAEFYLQTVDTVFVRHALPKGEMMHRDKPVDLKAIRRCALMTVEGERDDISGVGQTQAAHTLCVNIPDERRVHWVQPKVGHYGVFNGSRFRNEIAPRIAAFMAASAEQPAKSVKGKASLKVVGA
ncbi:MAG: polyhydroxyalkanoate depolymerase [Alphaproteobacteria bacterium]|nr:polyhydroxyalkanoate depolymerase [Alphaproteobacteria bacterium]